MCRSGSCVPPSRLCSRTRTLTARWACTCLRFGTDSMCIHPTRVQTAPQGCTPPPQAPASTSSRLDLAASCSGAKKMPLTAVLRTKLGSSQMSRVPASQGSSDATCLLSGKKQQQPTRYRPLQCLFHTSTGCFAFREQRNRVFSFFFFDQKVCSHKVD